MRFKIAVKIAQEIRGTAIHMVQRRDSNAVDPQGAGRVTLRGARRRGPPMQRAVRQCRGCNAEETSFNKS